MLTRHMKGERVAMSSELLELYNKDPESFMFRIVIRNESLVYYNHPESKTKSLDWKHTCYPRSKQPKVISDSKKQMATVFGIVMGLYPSNIFLRLILRMLTNMPIF